MAEPIRKLPKLKPFKFPPIPGRPSMSAEEYAATASPGRPTSEVIAEMKRLAKMDIFPTKD